MWTLKDKVFLVLNNFKYKIITNLKNPFEPPVIREAPVSWPRGQTQRERGGDGLHQLQGGGGPGAPDRVVQGPGEGYEL